SIVVAIVNVSVLGTGHGLVALVASTTAVRILFLGAFVWNAYRVFPGLRVKPSLFRRARLREVTVFSVYMAVLDWSAKLNYSSDTMVIGAMLDTSAIALWTVGQRLTQLAQQLTSQLNGALFPAVVDSDATERQDQLQLILIQGTKLSLALAAPLCLGLIPLPRRRSAAADHADDRPGAKRHRLGDPHSQGSRRTSAAHLHQRGGRRRQRGVEHRARSPPRAARRRAGHVDSGGRVEPVRALPRG